MQESVITELEMHVPVREIRAQAGVFLHKLGPLSQALVLVAAGHYRLLKRSRADAGLEATGEWTQV